MNTQQTKQNAKYCISFLLSKNAVLTVHNVRNVARLQNVNLKGVSDRFINSAIAEINSRG